MSAAEAVRDADDGAAAMIAIARKQLAITDARLAENPSANASASPPFITISAALDEMVELSKSPVYATPHATLNLALGLGGCLGGQVYNCAAGTGRGKTSFVGGLAQHWGSEHDVILAFYEAFAAYPLARIAGGELGVHSNVIIREAAQRRDSVAGVLSPRIRLLNRPSLAIMRQAVDYLAQKNGRPPVLFVDYEQKLAAKIQSEQKRPDARVAMSEASSGLLELADRTKALVIAVDAMSRFSNRRAVDPRKMAPYEFVDVAKESGAVEYDSAGLIMLTLSDAYEDDERVATLTVAKARFGEEMHVDMRFNPQRGSWRDLGRVEPAPKEDLRDQIRESLEEKGAVTSATEMAKRLRKSKPAVLAAFKAMVKDGEIVRVDDRFEVSS